MEGIKEIDTTEEHLDRVVEEILGGVDVWTASIGGPNGPWLYTSLSVRRIANKILIYDVDGRLFDTVMVHNLSDGDNAATELRFVLEWYNNMSMEAL